MNKSKIFMMISIMVLIVSVLGSVGTYAWYVWSTSDDEKTEIATGVGTATVIYDAGANMVGQSIWPVSDKTSGLIKTISIKTSKDTTSKISFNLYLDINSLDEGLKDESFKYELYSGSTLKASGNFSEEYLNSNLASCSTNNTNHIVLLTNETVTTTQSQYTLYIWIDGVNYTNPTSMQGANFSFKLHADGQNAILKETLVSKIQNLYDNATKIAVTNNSITYNYATEVGLMNDRLGGTTGSLDGGNIRYYGASPNNYIYFNCSDYSNQSSSTCELWRIIGVFDDKVKIVRNASLGSYAWDNKNTSTGAESDYGKNDWTTARLMKLLNPSNYYTTDSNDSGYGQSLYWNSESGTCFSGSGNATTSCNFTSTGIKNDTTRNMIAEMSWNIGGWNSATIYSNQVYGYERGTTVYSGRPTVWTGKVGLMYPSDYGYATDFSKCSQTLVNYDSSTDSYACRANDWLYNSSIIQWLLTPSSGGSDVAWFVHSTGRVNYNLGVYGAYGVRPVLYLSSDIVIERGNTGTSEDPYRISLS